MPARFRVQKSAATSFHVAPNTPKTPVPPTPSTPSSTPAPAERPIQALESAERLLEFTQVLLAAVAIFLGVFTILASVIGFVVIKNWAQQAARDSVDKTMAKVMHWVSVVDYRRVRGVGINLSLAIKMAERALDLVKDDLETETMIKSNLAYYYADEGRSDRKEVALEYAAFGRRNYTKFPAQEFLIDNDVFARARFSPDNQRVLGALHAEINELLRDHPNIENDLRESLRIVEQRLAPLRGQD